MFVCCVDLTAFDRRMCCAKYKRAIESRARMCKRTTTTSIRNDLSAFMSILRMGDNDALYLHFHKMEQVMKIFIVNNDINGLNFQFSSPLNNL